MTKTNLLTKVKGEAVPPTGFSEDLIGRTAKLFETADHLYDPEGLITKFVRYESFRIHREGYKSEMIGTLPDRMKVLFWYLGDYVRDRNYSYVPLSSSQLAFLNRPASIAGVHPAATVALHNFVLRDIPGHHNLMDPDVLLEAVYWWCIEKSPICKFDDRLVTHEQVTLLKTEKQWVGEDFALNGFMIHFFNRHVNLHSLDMNIPRDRAAFFHYLILYSFTHPYVLRFLPRDGLRRALKATDLEPSVFDRVLACYAFQRGYGSIEDAIKLHSAGVKLLRKEGLDIDRDRPVKPQSTNTGECFREPRQALGSAEPGVAIIGPILKTSGLGQATRLSLDILSRCEKIKPTVLDFDLDNPAPVGFASETSFGVYRNPRTVNLIHLNAESIPLAFAYKPYWIFKDSYNIGYFFWELNMIPKCHRLALELLDEIWVSSEYNREIYSRFTDKPVINVGMAVEPLLQVVPTNREDLGVDEDDFVFLTTFDSFSFIERKNPLGVIEAFARAFPLGSEKVRLIIKTQNRFRVFDHYQMQLWRQIDRAVSADLRITIINETLKYSELLALKKTCDCYVSLHRSEGWGFGMIEAMQLGLPVIATAFSGNLEFCNADTAYLVDYELVAVREEEYIFVERGSQWAQPNIDQAASKMRSVAADTIAAQAKGAASAAFIETNFNFEAIGRRYNERLKKIEERVR